MLSIIVCSQNDRSLHRDHVAATIGVDHEYIRLENSYKQYPGIGAAYNDGVRKASGELLVFMHEDAGLSKSGWGNILVRKFDDSRTGVVGVVGAHNLLRDNLRWDMSGCVEGRIAKGEPENLQSFLYDTQGIDVLREQEWELRKVDTAVMVIDGLFFAIPKYLFNNVKFDEQTFDGFHFYDLDICMQVRKARKQVIVTTDLLVAHFSADHDWDSDWEMYGDRFLEKWNLYI